MRRTTLYPLALLCLACLVTASVQAAPRPAAQTPRHDAGEMFVGTPAELVAAAMPEMLARVHIAVNPAAPALAEELATAFGGSAAFVWGATCVQLDEQGNGFSYTLPARVDTIRDRYLVLGIVEAHHLAAAYEVQVILHEDSVQFRFARPDGSHALNVDLGLDGNGALLVAPVQLLKIVTLFYPNAAKGTFDPIIEALQGALNALYNVLNMINMAICAVNEAIELMYELNDCPLYDIDLATGELAQAIICLVKGVIAFVDEVQFCF